jgi:hypothetical protein
MKLFEQKKVDELPVVSINDPSNVIGYVSRQDVIATYNRESLKFNLADGFASELKKVDENYKSKVADNYSIIEKKVPDSFVGKTLAELQLRNKYGVQVLMIKQMKSPFAEDERVNEFIVPDPTYVIQTDDTLVLFGRDDQVVKI